MTTHVAHSLRQLQLVTVEELMREPEEALGSVHWQWVDQRGVACNGGQWLAYDLAAAYLVGQLKHVLLCGHREACQRRPLEPAGLQFRVVTASGRRAIISSADEVKAVCNACSPNGDAFKNSKALLSAMRSQSEHQVGLDAAML